MPPGRAPSVAIPATSRGASLRASTSVAESGGATRRGGGDTCMSPKVWNRPGAADGMGEEGVPLAADGRSGVLALSIRGVETGAATAFMAPPGMGRRRVRPDPRGCAVERHDGAGRGAEVRLECYGPGELRGKAPLGRRQPIK
jgi:hypothetical protein